MRKAHRNIENNLGSIAKGVGTVVWVCVVDFYGRKDDEFY